MPILTYALNKENVLVNVDEVPLGLKCGCICPYCGAKLYAKNGGEIREHHFAHEHGAECEGAYESSLHLLAKEVLKETGCIMLPTFDDDSMPTGLVKIHDVETERWDEQLSIRPDAEGILDNGERLMIEFYFSHKVDAKKRQIIIANKLKCIEIDINFQELNRAEFTRFLTESADDREWVKPKDTIDDDKKKPGGSYSRDPMYDIARDKLKEIFDTGPFHIGGCIEFGYIVFDIKKYGYDICEVDTKYKGFKADLLLSRGRAKEKDYIAICIRGRRRYEPFKKPHGLRIIDIVLSNNFYPAKIEELVREGKPNYDSSGFFYWNFKHKKVEEDWE